MEIAEDKYTYSWPDFDFSGSNDWRFLKEKNLWQRDLREGMNSLNSDSRWPAMFPSPIAIVTTTDGTVVGLEKVVAPVIVNRFPYVMSLSFCREALSQRHYPRKKFTELLERGTEVAVQFLAPGTSLYKIMDTIAAIGDDDMGKRIKATGLNMRKATTNRAPVFEDAYLVYEAKLIESAHDCNGDAIFKDPHTDVGSHRIYFLEITAIQLRNDIAQGKSQICWQSLPDWAPQGEAFQRSGISIHDVQDGRYKKGYNPRYRFPSKNTIAFSADCIEKGMAVKKMSSQVIADNDDSRWPCFFPSSCGLITSLLEDGTPNLMPCGSTAVVSRFPFTFGICVAYASINERYKPRSSLEIIRKSKKFGCGVPFINDKIVEAITYAGNRSISDDKEKIFNSGLAVDESFNVPVLTDLPIFFECQVTGEIKLGTHVMFLGEVRKIFVRHDVTAKNNLRWSPWARVEVS